MKHKGIQVKLRTSLCVMLTAGIVWLLPSVAALEFNEGTELTYENNPQQNNGAASDIEAKTEEVEAKEGETEAKTGAKTGAQSALEHVDSSRSRQIKLYINEQRAEVNGQTIELANKSVVLEGRAYIPVQTMAEVLGMGMIDDKELLNVTLSLSTIKLTLDKRNHIIMLNDQPADDVQALRVIEEQHYIQLAWLCHQLGAAMTHLPSEHAIVINYRGQNQDSMNISKGSAPVARFIVDKHSYGIGEYITYTNLSYDPDAEDVSLLWTGKQDAFFTAGEHEVTLVAVDRYGHQSPPYTRSITVTDRVLFDEFEFGVYTSKPGTIVTAPDDILSKRLLGISDAKKKVNYATERDLIFSDSPENIIEQGKLYEDVINGEARLYANHVNVSGGVMDVAILATNSTSDTITLRTTNKGEVSPSTYAMLLGSEAVADYLMDNKVNEELAIAPGETVIYQHYPSLDHSYGIHSIYDVESTGELTVTVVAARVIDEAALQLPQLGYEGHIRGSFPLSDIYWQVDLGKRKAKKLQRLVIGDGQLDAMHYGYDPARGEASMLKGNYGVVYHIKLKRTENKAIMVMARGGQFKGVFKVDGTLVRIPSSGVLMPKNNLAKLAHTSDEDHELLIQYIAPAGSSLPIQLIFYPLDARSATFMNK